MTLETHEEMQSPKPGLDADQTRPEEPASTQVETSEKPSHVQRERIANAKERLGRSMEQVGTTLERPMIGAGVAGGLVAAAAGLWGPTEAALGALVGLVAYRILKKRYRQDAEGSKDISTRERPPTEPVTGFAG
jgi:hypothetical protein